MKILAIREDMKDAFGKRNQKNVLNDTFWEKIRVILEIMTPIKKWITILEGDNEKISSVACAFAQIRKKVEEIIPNSFLKTQRHKILLSIRKRRAMCLTPLHFAANILDPRLKGKTYLLFFLIFHK